MNYNLVVGAPIVAIIGAIVLFIVFVVPAAVLAQRVLNDTREGSTGAITNYADEENGLAAGEKAMKYNRSRGILQWVHDRIQRER